MTVRKGDRRQVERRAGKRGVTVRHTDPEPHYIKRIRRGRPSEKR